MKYLFFLTLISFVMMAQPIVIDAGKKKEPPTTTQLNPKIRGCNQSQGWGYFCKFNQEFQRRNQFSIEGQIRSMEPVVVEPAMSDGLLMKIKLGDRLVEVLIGPDWYFQKQDDILRPGDKVLVSGYKGVYENKEWLRAERMVKDSNVIELIDGEGRLAWSAWTPLPTQPPRKKIKKTL